MNVSGVELGLPTVAEQDRSELDAAAEKQADSVAASFVRDGELTDENGSAPEDFVAAIRVIAGTERDPAVADPERIIAAASDVMVARGERGVERPRQYVPMIRKRDVRRCHGADVPVITTTEMLYTGQRVPLPTRYRSVLTMRSVSQRRSRLVGPHGSRRDEALYRTSSTVGSGGRVDRAVTRPHPLRDPCRPSESSIG